MQREATGNALLLCLAVLSGSVNAAGAPEFLSSSRYICERTLDERGRAARLP